MHHIELLSLFIHFCRHVVQCIDPRTALGQCELLASLRQQLRALRKAEAHIIIARLTSTIKLDGKCNSCQLAKNTRPLCVIIDVIVSAAGRHLLVGPVMHERSLS